MFGNEDKREVMYARLKNLKQYRKMKKDIITEKSIKELVELVQEGNVHEIVIDDEIDKNRYVIYKNDAAYGVCINISPKKEPVKKPKYAKWEGKPDEFLDKALDYMKEPFPKVTKEVLDSYKLFLGAELKRLIAVREAYTIRFNNNLKILKAKEKSVGPNEIEAQKIKTGNINLEIQHIRKKIIKIEQFLSNGE